MLQVKVCVGSSCHIRGGAKTLKVFKSLIETHGLGASVDLAADLCLENCIQAPNVVIGNTTFGGITPDKAEEFFITQILPRVDDDAEPGNYHNQ
ncbi:MAG: (2Fe-2S) ferredoxin domain-containing protein [Armatimonadota bacterium]